MSFIVLLMDKGVHCEYKLKQNPNNIVEAVIALLKICKIKTKSVQVQQILIAHPEYPSLLSISESLLEWGVKTEALQGTIYDLSTSDFPSIVHLKNNEYIVAESLQGERISLIFPGNNRQALTLENFSAIWSGIVLRVLPRIDTIGYLNPILNYMTIWGRVQRFLSWPIFFIFIIVYFFYLLFSCPEVGLLLPIGIIKLLGLVICATLFFGHSSNSHLLDSICHSGKISNCNRVVNSPAGKIFGIPMAELGLLYFSGGFLVLFFSSLADSSGFSLFVLGILSFLTLPYTLFSISYQAIVLHSWCWLCLTIQVLFWLEATILFKKVFNGLQFPRLEALFPMIFGFGLTILLWIPIRRLLQEYPILKKKEKEIARLLCQPEYLQYQFTNATPIDIAPLPTEIIIGPTSAPITLTLVVNPLCSHCSNSFVELTQMIYFNQGTVRGVIRFLVVGNADENIESEKRYDYQIALYITTLAVAGKHDMMMEALSSWFAYNDSLSRSFLRKWRKKYAIADIIAQKKAEEILLMHESWTRKNDIHSTPALYMNGLTLPNGIGFKELKYFLCRLPNE